MALPPLTEEGELPLGVHRASLREVRERFGVGSAKRKALALQKNGRILASEAGRRPAGHRRDHRGGSMIADDHELNASLERIRHLQDQVAYLRQVETNPANYHLSASGFLAEIDRMQLEVREYLSLHPGELEAST